MYLARPTEDLGLDSILVLLLPLGRDMHLLRDFGNIPYVGCALSLYIYVVCLYIHIRIK